MKIDFYIAISFSQSSSLWKLMLPEIDVHEYNAWRYIHRGTPLIRTPLGP